MGRWIKRAAGVVLLAVASAGAWWAWLAWDTTYYTDADTGYPAGPYMAWQVIGCVLTLLVVAAIAYTRLNPIVVGVVMTLAFTTAYAVTAVSGDDTGLAGVGVFLVFVGMSMATAVLGTVAYLLRGRIRVAH